MAFRNVAIEAARKAGTIQLSADRTSKKKADHDILTEADTQSEEAILGLIKKYFPDHAVLAEESGADQKISEYLWVVDPLDGTINFANGLDEFCVSIALL